MISARPSKAMQMLLAPMLRLRPRACTTARVVASVHRRMASPWIARDASSEHWRDNTRQTLSCCADEDLVETADPCDSAHDDRVPGGRKYAQNEHGGVPARRLLDRPRRRYPKSAMTSRGVAHDSAYDDLYEVEAWLLRHGLIRRPQLSAIAPDWHAIAQTMGREQMRSLVQGRTGQAMSPQELALEQAGSAWLGRGLGEPRP